MGPSDSTGDPELRNPNQAPCAPCIRTALRRLATDQCEKCGLAEGGRNGRWGSGSAGRIRRVIHNPGWGRLQCRRGAVPGTGGEGGGASPAADDKKER